MRSGGPNKKSGPGFPAALPLFQPIRPSGYLTKDSMFSILQKPHRIVLACFKPQILLPKVKVVNLTD